MAVAAAGSVVGFYFVSACLHCYQQQSNPSVVLLMDIISPLADDTMVTAEQQVQVNNKKLGW